MSAREEQIDRFLAAHGWLGARRVALAGDASFRRYVRLLEPNRRAILMDAPAPREDVRPFLGIAGHLAARGYSPPTVFAADLDSGLVLLEDLGDAKYSQLLDGGGDAVELYGAAVDLLLDLHGEAPPSEVPSYDEGRLLDEVLLFADWTLPAAEAALAGSDRAAFVELWRAAFAFVRGGRDVLVLRDYHADNLIWLEGRAGHARIGLLDFQDALSGPAAYDLVSLLEDARRDVAPDLAEAMVRRYVAGAALDDAPFRTAYAVLGAQRNTKIIGIFTRLFARDGKARYLDFLPRVWRYLERDLEHPALADLRSWFCDHAPAHVRLPCVPGVRPRVGVSTVPRTAMVLAAGRGLRMRPLTLERPKPLVEVAGAVLLDRVLDRLADAAVATAVVNLHDRPAMMRAHLNGREAPAIVFSDESARLLGTGGGVAHALAALGGEAFFVANSDIIWLDGVDNTLHRLARCWDDGTMDALLLLQPTARAVGYGGRGDYMMAPDGVLRRRPEGGQSADVFAGLQILHPRLFADLPEAPFPLNLLYDRAEAKGRLFGLRHEGVWMHVGSPAGRAAAEAALKAL